MRNVLLIILVASPSAAFLLGLTSIVLLRRFLGRIPALRSPAGIQAFKRFVSGDMYRSVCVMGLMAVTILCFVGGIVLKALHVSDFLWAFGPWAAVLVLTPLITRLEARMRTLPADDPQIAVERDRIVRVWRRSIFPDW